MDTAYLTGVRPCRERRLRRCYCQKKTVAIPYIALGEEIDGIHGSEYLSRCIYKFEDQKRDMLWFYIAHL